MEKDKSQSSKQSQSLTSALWKRFSKSPSATPSQSTLSLPIATSSTLDSRHHTSAALPDPPASSLSQAQHSTTTTTSCSQYHGLAGNPPENSRTALKTGSSTKDILKVTGRSILTLTKKLPEIIDANPVKMAIGLVKLMVEIQRTLADNMDAIKRKLTSTRAQLETLERELGGWTPKTAQDGQCIDLFKLALKEELDKLIKISEEWLVSRVSDYDKETARIMEIFERINEARVRFELAIGIRVFKSVYDMENALKKLLFDRLEPSKIADHKYYLESKEERRLSRQVCKPGTHVHILDDIVTWVKNTSPDNPNVYWLFGEAGSGKTTIAYTVARRFEFAGDPNDTITLGGNFFCSRLFQETRLSRFIIRTVVHHLALKCRAFSDKLSDGDFDTVNQNVRAQLDVLLIAPWQASKPARCQDPSKPPLDYLIIIDGLDEIDGTGGSEFLRNLLEVVDRNKNRLQGLRFFVTSRPDPNLFRHVDSLKSRQLCRLEAVSPQEAHSDIRTFPQAELPISAGSEKIESLVVQAAKNAVPLFRAYSGGGRDHFYTTNEGERQNAVAHLGFTDEGVMGYIFSNQEPHTIPLYRLYSAGWIDHFYTTNAAERDNAVRNIGFSAEGIVGYIYDEADYGGLPLYRLWSDSAKDHLYTTSAAERNNASHNLGYNEEGIVGYILREKIESPVMRAAENAVPLFRAYSGGGRDHLYTTNEGERQNAVARLGFTDEGVTGYIFSNQEPHTIPLYRLYSAGWIDHFYTTNAAERDNAVKNIGYSTEGIAGYIYDDADYGGLPLYRLWSDSAKDHFYTMSAAERKNASQNLGYSEEGIVGYIFPS